MKAAHRASPKQLAEKIRLLGSLLDGLNDAQIASELSRYGLAYNEIWELGILVDSALRAARKLRRSSK